MKTVLMLSCPNDAHILPVQTAVQRMGGSVLFCNIADFPEKVQLSATLSREQTGWDGTLSFQQQAVVWRDIQSIWWRRPKRYQPERYAPEIGKLLSQEAYYGFLGLLLGSPDDQQPFWVSRPYAIRVAEFKASQLALAQRLGLRVPKTLITNEPGAVQVFYEECEGKVICKPVWKGNLTPGEQATPEQPRIIYTNHVQYEHLALLDGVRATAHCFQQYIEKQLEVRVVVIGRQMFAVTIHSQASENTRLDWRRCYADLQYGVHVLPDDLKQRLFQLVSLFGLQYASMDLILTPEGEYVFVEVNPNGQFYWLEPPTGLPMAQAMAHLLVSPEEYALC
ncbi:MAG: hypothetical protein JO202_07345 [Ktedonobacteraceae bacterium]|nr:hypothetical protein [Ktedonobacteraceae bacterium]